MGSGARPVAVRAGRRDHPMGRVAGNEPSYRDRDVRDLRDVGGSGRDKKMNTERMRKLCIQYWGGEGLTHGLNRSEATEFRQGTLRLCDEIDRLKAKLSKLRTIPVVSLPLNSCPGDNTTELYIRLRDLKRALGEQTDACRV